MDKTKVLDDIRTQELINWIKGTFLNKNEDISLSSDEIDDIIDNAIEEAEEEAYGTKVAVPTFTATIYYDGTEKTAVFNGYDPNKMTVTGNTATNVGNYTATFTLKQGFQWVDETTAPKEVAWSIQAEPVKTQLTVPTFTSTITYDGTEKTATFTGYDSETMTVSGNTGTNAGTYTATFGIKDKSQYEWSDGTSADKTVTWTIGKATGSFTLDKNSISLDSTTTSDTVTATIVGDGTLTATSSDSTVATVTKNGNTFTVSSVGDTSGTATITFSLAAGTNYTGASSTISVSVAGSVPQIVIGDTYSFGGFDWTAAEDLGNNAVCLQSQGMTSGTWPAYKLTTDYTGTKDYGSANNTYADDIDGDNIANYDDVTSTWYSEYGVVEKTGQSYGSGLFLVSNSKVGQTTSGQQGSGNYWSALKTAATNYKSFGASSNCSWLGTVNGSNYAWFVSPGGNVYSYNYQDGSCVVAPAFNLDLTKVNIDSNNVITKKQNPLTLGQEYTINGKTFIAAEDLGNGKYAMQANQSWATGSWPGYRANNNQVSDNNFEFQSVAPYYTEANTWYNNDVKYIEDQTHKYGPYLVSAEKCGINGTGQIGSGYYYRGLADACNHLDCYGSWLGTIFGTVSWAENEIYVFYSTNSGGQSYHMPQNQAETDLAPAFNIDTSKIEIDSNNVITKK